METEEAVRDTKRENIKVNKNGTETLAGGERIESRSDRKAGPTMAIGMLSLFCVHGG